MQSSVNTKTDNVVMHEFAFLAFRMVSNYIQPYHFYFKSSFKS